MLKVYPAPPFRLDLTVWALRRLPLNLMDRWDGETYRRILVLGGKAVEVSLQQAGSVHRPELLVRAEGISFGAAHKAALLPVLGRMLGFALRLQEFEGLAAGHPGLEALLKESPGLKPPRFPSIFEALVNGYACQQLSLTVGITLLNRLCAEFGLPYGSAHAFPRPEDLSHRSVEELRRLGFSARKAGNIIGLAQQIIENRLDLESFAGLTDEVLIERLQEIPGIGRWTAEYAALRGYGRLNVFPADDVGGQAKLQEWLHLKTRPDYQQVLEILAPWAPYRGLIYFYLLRHYQVQKGFGHGTEKEFTKVTRHISSTRD